MRNNNSKIVSSGPRSYCFVMILSFSLFSLLVRFAGGYSISVIFLDSSIPAFFSCHLELLFNWPIGTLNVFSQAMQCLYHNIPLTFHPSKSLIIQMHEMLKIFYQYPLPFIVARPSSYSSQFIFYSSSTFSFLISSLHIR